MLPFVEATLLGRHLRLFWTLGSQLGFLQRSVMRRRIAAAAGAAAGERGLWLLAFQSRQNFNDRLLVQKRGGDGGPTGDFPQKINGT